MKDHRLAGAIEILLDARMGFDPSGSVPVYDLHDDLGRNTGYCLVRADWLDELWKEASTEYRLIPHDHIDPSETG